MTLSPDSVKDSPAVYTMTAAQRRVLAAMDKSNLSVHGALPAARGTFWQVALGVVGVGLVLAGTVLVFFFAALGAVSLIVGGLSLVAALQGIGLSDRAAHVVPSPETNEVAAPPGVN